MQEHDWLNNVYHETVNRLQELVATPSLSKEEGGATLLFENWMKADGIAYVRKGNNLIARSLYTDHSKPAILLNSHLDTVKPNAGYTKDPFNAVIAGEKLYGLGSNDAGGALMCLYAVFKQFYRSEDLKYNLVFAATAEEEISGRNGIESIITEIEPIDLAVVGEPTQMHLAVAEKGLLVLDCVVYGKAGHAARNEGENAIYKALKDLAWFQSFSFPLVSGTLGEVKMSVTMIEAGTQHNVVPAECKFTVDIRCTDAYTHEELLDIIKAHTSCAIKPRSLRLKPSAISMDHPIVKAGIKLGRNAYGSPTTSDQALMPFTSLKIGPGDSARSHQADEFIYLQELKEGIQLYHQLLTSILY
ncbi:MAG: M20 family metallo-hydrolase [Bacteroidota bacterium]